MVERGENFSLQRADEIDIGALVRVLWNGRGIIFGTALLVLALVMVSFIGRFFTTPAYLAHSIQIQFSFSGLENGQYPNGTPFRLSDVISPQVIDTVYDKYELTPELISREDFASRISIEPFAINRDFIDAKYKGQLESKKLSQAEIAEIEKAYRLELEAATLRSARLLYASRENEVISASVIGDILFALPEVWADYALKQRGIFDLPVYSADAFEVDRLGDEEYVAGAAIIRDDINRMLDSLRLLASDTRMALIREKESGYTAQDLQTRLKTFSKYHLEAFESLILSKSAYRDIDRAKIFLRGRMQRLNDDIEALRREAEIYAEAFDRHLRASQLAAASSGAVPMNSTTQISSDTIGQLLSLGDELSESKYRQALTDKRIAISTEQSSLQSELELVARLLAGIDGEQSNDAVSVNDEYGALLASYRELVNAYGDLIGMAKENALADTHALYQFLTSKASHSNMGMARVMAVAKYVVLAVLLGFFLGVVLVILRSAISRQKS